MEFSIKWTCQNITFQLEAKKRMHFEKLQTVTDSENKTVESSDV